ncbi:MAG TPA: hypothetical protein VNO30_26260 [Kofleriaceae bacterium]|nr:hypothetical protein [Kofleriaceae bacterium]
MALAGCLTEGGSEPDQAQVLSELSTPVLGGDLPGFSAAQAKAIAVAYFNQTSQFAAYDPFTVGNTHSWAYAVEDFHYVESYTYIEVCGGYVRRNGAITDNYCYLRIGP